MQKGQFEKICQVEMAFHMLLFIYKSIVQDILGSGAAIFEHPTYNALSKVLEEDESICPFKGKIIEGSLKNYLSMLKDSGLVKEVEFERAAPNRYTLHVDKCIYAKSLHQRLKPFLKGQTCRYALLAAVIFREYHGDKVKISPSVFTAEGSKTRIEL